jgi:hypothetical protein
MKLGRILTTILLTSAMLLVGATIYVGTAMLTNTTSVFSASLSLTGRHSLEISKRPICDWYVPSINSCYYGGQPKHSEVSLVYHTSGIRQALVVFELPGR